MDFAEFESLAARLDGVRTSTREGLLECRYRGRLVARQIDGKCAVVRCSFDVRDRLLAGFPTTFSVPARWANHMMIVADVRNGEVGAIEDALIAAWRLQSDGGS